MATTKPTKDLAVGDYFVDASNGSVTQNIGRVTAVKEYRTDTLVEYESINFIDERGRQAGGFKPEAFWVNDTYTAETVDVPEFTGVAVVIEVENAATGKVTHTRHPKRHPTHKPGCRYLSPVEFVQALPERWDPWNKCWVPTENEYRAHWPSLGPVTCKACRGSK